MGGVREADARRCGTFGAINEKTTAWRMTTQ